MRSHTHDGPSRIPGRRVWPSFTTVFAESLVSGLATFLPFGDMPKLAPFVLSGHIPMAEGQVQGLVRPCPREPCPWCLNPILGHPVHSRAWAWCSLPDPGQGLDLSEFGDPDPGHQGLFSLLSLMASSRQPSPIPMSPAPGEGPAALCPHCSRSCPCWLPSPQSPSLLCPGSWVGNRPARSDRGPRLH